MTIAAQAATDANELLATTWWTNDTRDRPLPVDPMAIAKQLGIDVVMAFLPSDVSGSIEREGNKSATIYLNLFDSTNRQRFTCAHELGHYRSRLAKGLSDFAFTDYRSTLAAAGTDREEIWANQFAAALLMPQHIVTRWHGAGLAADHMAKLLGTSAQAMDLRLRNLRLS